MRIILYGSQYGTAKRYAEELGRRTGIAVQSFEEAGDISCCQTIVYIGGLYAGGVLGMKKTLENLKDPREKRLIIATVGLADPEDEKNWETIRRAMRRQLPPAVFEQARIFHMRGGIDYSKLNFKHKTMMCLLYQKAKNLPKEKRTAEVEAMIDTYNRQVSFVNFSSLDPIVEAISNREDRVHESER